jgi:hypothetical protein
MRAQDTRHLVNTLQLNNVAIMKRQRDVFTIGKLTNGVLSSLGESQVDRLPKKSLLSEGKPWSAVGCYRSSFLV